MEPMETAKNVDLERYAGRWYEIASFRSRFQPRAGTNTRATYTLNPDQTIRVLNETWVNGKRSSIEGTAWKADPASPDAKLRVRFWIPPFLPLFPVTGDYWVLHLDGDYQIALVGQPSRNYLWILSRTPGISEETYERVVEEATRRGYDVSRLVRTDHPQGEDDPSLRSEATDRKGLWWIKAAFGR